MPTLNINGNIRVNTAAGWAADATVYSAKTLMVTSDATFTGTDFRKIKLADGTQTWSQLDYLPIDTIIALGQSLQNQINNLDLETARAVNNVLQGNIDADGNTIENIATPVNPGDAIPLGYSALTDSRYRKYIDYDNATHSVTGTLTETILVGDLLIPAGTLGANDSLMINALLGATGTANTKVFRVYINTVPNDLTGASVIGVFTFSATTLSSGFRRAIVNKGSVALQDIFPVTQTAASDFTASTVGLTTLNYNFANDAYIIVTGDLANIGDAASCNNIQLTKDTP